MTDPEGRVVETGDTGDPRVDDAVARTAELSELSTAEHIEVYEDIHRRLHGALTDVDGS